MALKTFFHAFSRAAAGLLGGLFLASAAVAAPVALTSLLGSPVEGSWKTQDGTEITVAPCAQGFCGTLSWVLIPKQYQAQCEQDKTVFATQMLDYQNPDPAQKTRPILGLPMMTLTPTGDPTAFTAKAYNPQDGSTNEISVWILADNTMRIGGACLGTVCAVTQDWPKVPPRAVAPDFTCEGGQ